MRFFLLILWELLAIASPALAQCALIPPGPGFHHRGMTYVISQNAYDTAEGLEAKIRSEYGASARLADWQDLKQVLGSGLELQEFIAETGLPLQSAGGPCNNILVANMGVTQMNGYMIFLARHDATPRNWFVIDTIGNHAIDLGRFYYHSQALIALPDDETRTPENAIATRLAELLFLTLLVMNNRQTRFLRTILSESAMMLGWKNYRTSSSAYWQAKRWSGRIQLLDMRVHHLAQRIAMSLAVGVGKE